MKAQNVISDFKELISIQSVSTDPERFGEILKASDFLSEKLKKLGFKTQLIGKGKAPPLLIANLKSNNKNAKTIAIYGHYDVQPEDPVSEWKTSPFNLELKNKRFFGRGVSDNKGPIIQNIAAIENLIEAGKLNNNITFIIEGEEESGGGHFEGFINQAKKELAKTDCFYVTDVELYDKTTPQIFYGLRGIIHFEIKVAIGESDVHSGSYGNIVMNPIQILSELFSKIKCSKTGIISIPHFYEGIRTVTSKEQKLLSKSWDVQKMNAESKVYGLYPCDKKHPHLSAKTQPGMDINGIISGYTGIGEKAIIPRSASAKFSFRLVEYQDTAKIEKLIRKFIEKEMPSGVKYELKTLCSGSPFYTSIENPFISKTAQILENSFGKKPIFNRDGASIPAAEVLQRLFHKPMVLTGFVNPDCCMHAPNENLEEECFWNGIEALERIYYG
jgi:acetylornithine deacetylase/succinyl-diaminopimelate desuccinylase-like protein